MGYGGNDDAAAYQIDEHRAILTTVDFITPPVDDPYWFGQIGAANSLSDIYAMGGKPLIVLNLVMYPMKKLGRELLGEILKGANAKVEESGAVMAGGHSVDDEEPKFGLCVTGIVNISDMLENRGANPGDAIVLTKPIGTGVLFNGVKSGKISYEKVETMLPAIATLNDGAPDIFRNHGVRAMTDVTGFGLGGHLLEVARGSDVTIRVDFGRVPLYDGSLDLYRRGESTGSNVPNKEYLSGHVSIGNTLSAVERELIYDPQTSGGLLASLPGDRAAAAVADLQKAGHPLSAVIGRVEEKGSHYLIFQ